MAEGQTRDSMCSAPGSSAESRSIGNKLDGLLREKFVGTFEIPLKQIAVTSLTRELNPSGLEAVIKSIRANGWLTHNPPALVLTSGGDDVDVTPESMPSRDFIVLDGNHRVSAAQRLFEPDKAVPCRVYRDLSRDAMRLVGDGELRRRVYSRADFFRSLLILTAHLLSLLFPV